MEYKIIQFPVNMETKKSKKTKEPKQPKEKKTRVIVNTKRWNNNVGENELNTDSQLNVLKTIDCNISEHKFLLRQIQDKIDGYKRQDLCKNRYSIEEFVDIPYVIQKLIQSELICYYCEKPMYILYQTSRDPMQWTLERIDNKKGHNKGNVEISCLSCNVSRRTMYHEKYRFTKQMVCAKLNHD